MTSSFSSGLSRKSESCAGIRALGDKLRWEKLGGFTIFFCNLLKQMIKYTIHILKYIVMSECHLGKFSQEAPGSHTSSLRVFLNQGPAPYTCRLKCLTFSGSVKNLISPRQAHVNSLSESVIRLLYKLHQYNITQI